MQLRIKLSDFPQTAHSDAENAACAALGRTRHAIQRATYRLKRYDDAVRCRLTVRLTGNQRFEVESSNDDVLAAIRAVSSRASRRVARDVISASPRRLPTMHK